MCLKLLSVLYWCNCAGAFYVDPLSYPIRSTLPLLSSNCYSFSCQSYHQQRQRYLTHEPLLIKTNNSFVCPTEIIAFSEAIERFSGLKTAVLACSCDSEFSHLAWVNTPRTQGGLGEMKIPIIADFTKKIATDYGVLKEDEGVAYRGLFIIDPKQVVRQITINDLPVGRNVDEVVRLVEAFQFTDEVCIEDFFFFFLL